LAQSPYQKKVLPARKLFMDLQNASCKEHFEGWVVKCSVRVCLELLLNALLSGIFAILFLLIGFGLALVLAVVFVPVLASVIFAFLDLSQVFLFVVFFDLIVSALPLFPFCCRFYSLLISQINKQVIKCKRFVE